MKKSVYSEVYAVLTEFGEGYIDRIPDEMLNLIKSERDLNYKPQIDRNKALNEQDICKEALATIAMLELNYWCNSEEEKSGLLKILEKNEQQIKETLNSVAGTRELLKWLKRK